PDRDDAVASGRGRRCRAGRPSRLRLTHLGGGRVVVVVVVGVFALVVGLALGWALRGPARWCPKDGDRLRCPTCQPDTVVGRAAVPMRQPAVPPADRPLMTPLAERRAPG